jgi:hypothetical protein
MLLRNHVNSGSIAVGIAVVPRLGFVNHQFLIEQSRERRRFSVILPNDARLYWYAVVKRTVHVAQPVPVAVSEDHPATACSIMLCLNLPTFPVGAASVHDLAFLFLYPFALLLFA